jgi:hypothetical protein
MLRLHNRVLLGMLHVAVHPCVLKHLCILLPCEIPTRWLTVTVRSVRPWRRGVLRDELAGCAGDAIIIIIIFSLS